MQLKNCGARITTIGDKSFYVRKRQGRKTILDPIQVLEVTKRPWERRGRKVSSARLLPIAFISFFEAAQYLQYYIPTN